MQNRRWSLIYSVEARRQLEDLDSKQSKRLVAYLEERILTLDDPRRRGKALRGSKWGEAWRYRCGDYRIIVRIEDDNVVLVVIRVGHRKDIY